MKTLVFLKLLITVIFFNAAYAYEAPYEYSYETPSKFYMGARSSSLLVDIGGVSDSNTIGLVFGYNRTPTTAIEVDVNVYDVTVLGLNIDWTTVASYYAYRSEGDQYFKYKIGYLSETLSNNIISVSDSGFSYGIGAGLRFDNLNIEYEFVTVEQDANSSNINLIYNF
jgi:hypothetical protein